MNGWKTIALVGGLIAVWVLCPQASATEYRRQSVQNDSGTAANDLHVEFSNPINQAKLRPKDQPPGHDGEGAVPSAPGNTYADWAPPDSFGTVEPGGIAYMDYGYSNYFSLADEANSYWTDDGNNVGGFTMRGRPMTIRGSDYDADTIIRNDEETAQQYMGVQLWKNNDMLHLNIDECFIPSGDMVPGIPEEFILQPGEEIVLPFGASDLGTYLLVFAAAATAGDPVEEPYVMLGASTLDISGDADLSGYVDDDDLSLLLANWHIGDEWGEGDFNGSGSVDDDDLSLLLANWHAGMLPAAGSPIPEPTTLGLLALGGLGLIRRHRR